MIILQQHLGEHIERVDTLAEVASTRRKRCEAEQAAVEQFWQAHSAFALRHDYTNCLRIWDLSVFFPDGTRAIQEVKAKKSVSSSQKRKGRMVVELTTHHESVLPEGDLLVHQGYLALSPDHNDVPTTLDLLGQALVQANQESIGFAANTYLMVAILDATNVAKRPPSNSSKSGCKKQKDSFPRISGHCIVLIS